MEHKRRLAASIPLSAVAFAMAGCGFLGIGSDDAPSPQRAIDLQRGAIGDVALGDSIDSVIARWGEPDERGGFAAPAEERPGFQGPWAIGIPGGGDDVDVLRYRGLAVLGAGGKVFALIGGDGVRTDRVQVGDPMATAHDAYPTIQCQEHPDGEPMGGTNPATHPECRAVVEGTRLIVVGDPIQSLSITAGPPE